MMFSRTSTAILLVLLSVMPLGLTAALVQAQTPRSSEDFFKRGVTRYQQQDLDGAIKDFDRALELQAHRAGVAGSVGQVRVMDPSAAPIYYNRAVACYDLHNWDEALADLNEAIRLNPRYVMAYIKRGNLRMINDAFAEAVNDFDQAIKLDPKSVIAWNNRGLARQSLAKKINLELDGALAEITRARELDAALADYARALELDPRLTVALNNRAGIKHDRRDFRGALNDYDQAIALDPQLALLYCNRGLTRKALGDLEGAIADYTEAIRLRPNFSLAYFNRSAAWKAMGKGYEAEADYMRSLSAGETFTDPSLEPPIERLPATKADKPPATTPTPKEKKP